MLECVRVCQVEAELFEVQRCLGVGVMTIHARSFNQGRDSGLEVARDGSKRTSQ